MSHDTHHNKIPYDQWSYDGITKWHVLFKKFRSFFVTPHKHMHLDVNETKEILLRMLLNTKDDND